MAKMMPPLISEDAPPGERMVFERLESDPETSEWYVLHSLHLSDVRNQLEGEVDFVVVAPGLGILCIEVKSHTRVSREHDGRWRLGSSPPTSRSPFEQASRGMYSVKNHLKSMRLGLDEVPVTSCVWFTGTIASIGKSIEWNDWQLLDLRDLRRPASQTVRDVLWQQRVLMQSRNRLSKHAREPNKSFARKIANSLRPVFELSLDPQTVRKTRDKSRMSFIEEQYEALDLIASSPRILFEGAAGTGKTNIAIEAANRAAVVGKRVLLVCYNNHLGAALREKFKDRDNVTAGTLHSFMKNLVPELVIDVHDEKFWTETLPDEALLAALELDEPYDVVVVDEAQDVAHERYFDLIDACLKGGIVGGEWRMFADFERQNIYGDRSGRALFDERSSSFVTCTLTKNCRNTPLIGAAALQLSGLRPNVYSGFRRRNDGVVPSYKVYIDDASQEKQLLASIAALVDEQYGQDEIVVLSTVKNGIARRSDNAALRSVLVPFSDGGSGVRYETIHAFKGLDAPAVIVTDVEPLENRYARSIFYVAITRACDRLYVIANQDAMVSIAEALVQGVGNDS